MTSRTKGRSVKTPPAKKGKDGKKLTRGGEKKKRTSEKSQDSPRWCLQGAEDSIYFTFERKEKRRKKGASSRQQYTGDRWWGEKWKRRKPRAGPIKKRKKEPRKNYLSIYTAKKGESRKKRQASLCIREEVSSSMLPKKKSITLHTEWRKKKGAVKERGRG